MNMSNAAQILAFPEDHIMRNLAPAPALSPHDSARLLPKQDLLLLPQGSILDCTTPHDNARYWLIAAAHACAIGAPITDINACIDRACGDLEYLPASRR